MKLFGILGFLISLAAAAGLVTTTMGCGGGSEFTSADYCAPGCLYMMTQDLTCQSACNNAACNWDNGHCDGQNDYCSGSCQWSYVGDGECDSSYGCNVAACNYDGGDCDTTECSAGSSPAVNDQTTCCPNGYPYYWASDGMCHTVAPGGHSAPTPTQSTTIPRDYKWSYDGTDWTWTLTISADLYEYYQEADRPDCQWGGDCDYSPLVTDSGDDSYIKSLVDALKNAAEDQGYDGWETINFAVSFVQSLPYTSDDITTGYDEYPRYPIETLVENGGDCEDTAILMATIIDEMGYGVVLINYEDLHYAVGIWGSEGVTGTYFSHNGNKYYYLETTGDGWKIGQMPPDFEGMEAYVYDVN